MDLSLLNQPGAIGGLVGGLVGLAGGALGTYCSWQAARGPLERSWVLRYAALILIITALYLALVFWLDHWLARTLLFCFWPLLLITGIFGMDKHLRRLRDQDTLAREASSEPSPPQPL